MEAQRPRPLRRLFQLPPVTRRSRLYVHLLQVCGGPRALNSQRRRRGANCGTASGELGAAECNRLMLWRAPEAKVSRSEEHTSELQSLMRISYAVFCLKKKNKHNSHSRIGHYKHTD